MKRIRGVVIDTKDDGHIMFVRDGGNFKILDHEKITPIYDDGKLVCLIDTDNIDAIHVIEEVRK